MNISCKLYWQSMKLVFNQRIMLNIVQSLIQNCQSPFSTSVTTVGPMRVTALLRRGEEGEKFLILDAARNCFF